MPIDRDLLWRAWPDGHLDVRGVFTVGGWERTANGWNSPTEYVHQSVAEMLSISDLVEILKTGDLLPSVDRDDVATWACLLADLARALGEHYATAIRLTWQENFASNNSNYRSGWVLGTSEGPYGFHDIHTNDPAEALVFARIQVRKETGR